MTSFMIVTTVAQISIFGEVANETKEEVARRGIEITYHDKLLGYGSFPGRSLADVPHGP